MPSFKLVDLDSQANEVARHVRGWEVADILDRLSQYGTVIKVMNPYDDRLYLFRSNIGIKTAFRFAENDQLAIVREHTTYQPGLSDAK